MKNNGYRITEMRTSDGAFVKIGTHASLPSTAVLAKKYAEKGYPDKYVVFTEKQRDTRLTGKRLSDGECDNGVFMSVILRPSFFPSQAALLNPLSAVAMLEGLKEYSAKSLQIGWLSNIFCGGRLIGGVSVEGKLNSFSSYEYIIVTFAISVSSVNFPPRLSDMIKKVFVKEDTSISLLMAKSILNKFFTVYTNLRTPAKFVEIYKKNFVLTGKRIKYIDEKGKHKCRVLGADNDCMLIIEDRKKRIKHISNTKNIIAPKRIRDRGAQRGHLH